MYSNLPEGGYADIVLGELSEEIKLGAEIRRMATDIQNSLTLLETFTANDASNAVTALYDDLVSSVEALEGADPQVSLFSSS
jgi:hypothetical protein